MRFRSTIAVLAALTAACVGHLGCGNDGPGEPGDTVPPATVGDMEIVDVTSSSATLDWTAPGDDHSNGTATRYDIRYEIGAWTDGAASAWDSKTPVDSVPPPREAGTLESFTVSGLLFTSPEGSRYYFALRAADEADNWSQTSNVVSVLIRSRGDSSDIPISPMTVLVTAGDFTFGDGNDSSFCGMDRRPVTLTRDYHMGRYEVTNQEYRNALQWARDQGYVTASPYYVHDKLDGAAEMLMDLTDPDSEISFQDGYFDVEPGKENHPVTMVTWYGAARYCDWLSLLEELPRAYDHDGDWSCNQGDPYGARGYRLPTDGEWEYAARHGDERSFPWGDEAPDCGRANFYDLRGSGEYCAGVTVPVGSYPAAPAAIGLHDMAGNVWEWCNDWLICEMGTDAAQDPPGPDIGFFRVLRGGSWASFDYTLRCSDRYSRDPSYADNHNGFRVARTAD